MSPAQRPSKEEVRQWLKREVAAKTPPPSPEEIKRQLGWAMCEAERDAIKRIDKGE